MFDSRLCQSALADFLSQLPVSNRQQFAKYPNWMRMNGVLLFYTRFLTFDEDDHKDDVIDGLTVLGWLRV